MTADNDNHGYTPRTAALARLISEQIRDDEGYDPAPQRSPRVTHRAREPRLLRRYRAHFYEYITRDSEAH